MEPKHEGFPNGNSWQRCYSMFSIMRDVELLYTQYRSQYWQLRAAVPGAGFAGIAPIVGPGSSCILELERRWAGMMMVE